MGFCMVYGPSAYPYRAAQTRYAVVGDTVAVGLGTRDGRPTPFIHSAGRPDALMYQVAEQQVPSLPRGSRIIVAAGTSEVMEGTRTRLDPQRFSETVHMGLTMILREAQMRGHTVSHIVGPMSPRLMGIQNPAFMQNAMMADRIMEGIARQHGIGYVSPIRHESTLASGMQQGSVYDSLRNIVASTPTSAPGYQTSHYGYQPQPAPYAYDRTPTYYRSRPPSMLDALTARLTGNMLGGNHYGHSHYGHTPYGYSQHPTMRVRTRVYVDDQTGEVLGRESRVVSPHYSSSPYTSNYGYRPQGYNMGISPMSFNPTTLIAGMALGTLMNSGNDGRRPHAHYQARPSYVPQTVQRPVIVQPPATIINNTIVRPPAHHAGGHHTHRPVAAAPVTRTVVAPTATAPVRTAVVPPIHPHGAPPDHTRGHRPPQHRAQT